VNADDAAIAVVKALDAAAVPYMLVGSFSSNYYGIPRSTEDADFVIELGDKRVGELVAHLGPQFELERQITFETITGTTRNRIFIADSGFKIELFRLSSDPHDQERFARRVSVPMTAAMVPVFLPTPEDVIITKLRWNVEGKRSKDRDDVADVITVQQDALDWDYIHHWCDQHRTRERLDEIRASIPPIDD
jgi:hypothetical protein